MLYDTSKVFAVAASAAHGCSSVDRLSGRMLGLGEPMNDQGPLPGLIANWQSGEEQSLLIREADSQRCPYPQPKTERRRSEAFGCRS